jgi:hypothetical protein
MNTQRAGVSGGEASTYRLGQDTLDEDEPTKLLHAFFHVLWCSRFRGQLHWHLVSSLQLAPAVALGYPQLLGGMPWAYDIVQTALLVYPGTVILPLS